MNKISIFLKLILLILLNLYIEQAAAQSPASQPPQISKPVDIPSTSYSPANFEFVDYEYIDKNKKQKKPQYIWRRPPEVHYIIIAGCGGGGGGGTGGGVAKLGNQNLNGAFGQGGKSGLWTTIFLGPLNADVYSVLIGKGGAGGTFKDAQHLTYARKGDETVFSGPDANIIFSSGDSGRSSLVTSTSGEDSMIKIHSGGESGGMFKNGSNATEDCAGGGGAGEFKGGGAKVGGKGGNGNIVIYPLPDFGQVFNLMTKLNN